MYNNKEHYFPGFEHNAKDLAAFLLAGSVGLFSISLKNGSVVHHEPQNPDEFLIWLRKHHIKSLKV